VAIRSIMISLLRELVRVAKRKIATPRNSTAGLAMTSLLRPRHHAAVDGEHGAVDVAGFIGGEEEEGAGDFFGLPDAPGGDARDHHLQDLFGHALDHIGGDEAGGDSVGGDVVAPELAGPDARHADDASLGCHVVGLPEVAVQAHNRRGADDPAITAFDHVRRDGLAHAKDADGIRVERLGPQPFVSGQQRAKVRIGGRVVDGDIHSQNLHIGLEEGQ